MNAKSLFVWLGAVVTAVTLWRRLTSRPRQSVEENPEMASKIREETKRRAGQ